ncbi:uncharacterized protein LODBEIA_P03980 [Lodderomyces beijingensis]|uniref:Fatty acid hydroxylase domain-containing protein n=1 Tax=Lodderomyces beijingensis TaxID=1775926 RepID=A0ABP0ZDB6_9ASCO
MSVLSSQNFSSYLEKPASYPLTITRKPDLIAGLPDGVLALISPIVAYWSYSMFFHIIDVYELAEKFRIHPSEDELRRNKVTLHEVIRDVVLQHIIQTVVGLAVFYFDAAPLTGYEYHTMWQLKQALPSWVPDQAIYYGYMYAWPLLRLCLASVVIDSWQYWLHRLMHVNRALYRRFHSRHHRLYVPYAFGALYNDPVEGFLLDTLGSGIASLVTGLSHREQIILYTFATLKTVDDHCGYRLPYDPFQIIFPNNSVYHDIHHQIWGIKNNFSQPFFTFWDVLNSTQYKFVNEYKDLQSHITLSKYKEFLARKSRVGGGNGGDKKEEVKNNNNDDKEAEVEDKKDI